MTSFYQVDESGGTSAVTLGEASEGSAIQDQYHEDVLTSNLDFDTVVDAGIYRYESIGDSSQHVPSDASSGYVFVFVENDKHSMRSIVQIAFDDNGGVLVRRGAISDTGTTIGAWEDLNASGSSTFAISSTSPAGTVGGSWSVVSGYEDVGIWKQVNIIMTLADAVNTTILLDVSTFALSGTQTIYVSNGDGTFSPIILDIVNGGTGANSAAGARTALGAASQADLDSLRDSVNNKLPFAIKTFGDISSITVGRYKAAQDDYDSIQLTYDSQTMKKSFHYLITPYGVRYLIENHSTGLQDEVFLIRK